MEKLVDLVHKMVNRATLRSTVDPRTERGRAGVPVLGTSPWRRGEQEERMGILTPGGMSWWRGSDGRASAQGGGSGASSTRRCSGRGGEGSRNERGEDGRGCGALL
jgi:hypothetical protein